jgi:hypothetical protein
MTLIAPEREPTAVRAALSLITQNSPGREYGNDRGTNHRAGRAGAATQRGSLADPV